MLGQSGIQREITLRKAGNRQAGSSRQAGKEGRQARKQAGREGRQAGQGRQAGLRSVGLVETRGWVIDRNRCDLFCSLPR
jgi:hypothetical protein